MTRALVCAVALAAMSVQAQLRESIEVRIVELEVSVLDRRGRPVEGLTRDDFTVRIGRQNVPIENFFAVRGGAIVADESGAQVTQPKQAVARTTSIPTSLVIFVDELHLSSRSRRRAIDAVQRYVAANVGPDTTATLIRYKGQLDVRVRPTERPGYIVAELEKVAKEPSIDDTVHERRQLQELIDDAFFANGKWVLSEMQDVVFREVEQYAERRGRAVDHSLEALHRAIDLTSVFNGRKVLLYVSDGLPQQPGIEMFGYFERALAASSLAGDWKDELVKKDTARAMQFDRTEEFRRLVQAAQKADVAIYSFDAGGVRGFEARDVQTNRPRESRMAHVNIDTMLFQSALRSGLQYVADETGGMYVANENDIDKLLSRMSEQFTSYYSIGVRPRRGDIRISMKNRPDLRVLTAKRAHARSPEEELEQDVRRRLYTRKEDNPLQAALHVGSASRTDAQCVVPVRVSVPNLTMQPPMVELRIVLLNEQNDETTVQRLSVASESVRVTHAMTLRIRPQRQVLSLAVTNPSTGESSFLQSGIDGTTCH